MKNSIALIGFMGSGKTAVGKVLAERLGKEFIELDALLERRAGKTIPQIFATEGEISFREHEIAAAKEVAQRDNAVIACGGGIVLNKINIDRLRIRCIIVYLAASPRAILRRTAGDSDRPLLNVADRMKQIEELWRFRRPFYERSADFTVNTSRLGVKAVAEQVVRKLREYEGPVR